MGQHSPRRPRQNPATPRSYAGPTTCLRCDARFQSWDRRQNRFCPRCRQLLAAQPSEEISHTIVKPRR
jgi:uncharacterized paraquat-inducible protein A